MLNTWWFLSAASFSPEHRPQINAITASHEGCQSEALFLSAASFSPEHRPQFNAITASHEGSQSEALFTRTF
jgi:hypothetical protein